ncbi:uncharacterized protein LOC108671952 [Hyalella azteca]|uniref:Uncharacterized protein LOC108671952 n=1 Tax=Hyalella azteca TaxID=294128 RepID=A0A8B7NMZ3_HYAAZ|nr:uncharacterized protein LOC108671952 [Hyalella azteca]
MTTNKYFDKRRALASAICISGNAFGGFIMPPLVDYLLHQFGLRGTLFITSAVMLNIVVAGVCFRPVSVHAIVQGKHKIKLKRRRQEIKKPVTSKELPKSKSKMKDVVSQRGSATFASEAGALAGFENLIDPALYDKRKMINTSSTIIHASNVSNSRKLLNNNEEFSDISSDSESSVHSVSELRLSVGGDDLMHIGAEAVFDGDLHSERRSSVENIELRSVNSVTATNGTNACDTCRVDSEPVTKEIGVGVLSSPVTNEPVSSVKSQQNLHYYSQELTTATEFKNPFLQGTTPPTTAKLNGFIFHKNLDTCFDYEVPKTRQMFLMTLSCFLFKMSVPHPLFYLHVYFISVDVDVGTVSAIIAGSSLADVVGRLGVSWLTRTKLVPAVYLYSFSCFVTGACILCVPVATSAVSLSAVLSGYGLGVVAWSVLMPVMLTQAHGSDRLPAAYGFLRIFMGVANFVSPQISGALTDATGSFLCSYRVMGACSLAAALLALSASTGSTRCSQPQRHESI